jgi:hypothetical protein
LPGRTSRATGTPWRTPRRPGPRPRSLRRAGQGTTVLRPSRQARQREGRQVRLSESDAPATGDRLRVGTSGARVATLAD